MRAHAPRALPVHSLRDVRARSCRYPRACKVRELERNDTDVEGRRDERVLTVMNHERRSACLLVSELLQLQANPAFQILLLVP